MTTLAEIEDAAKALPDAEQAELLRFLIGLRCVTIGPMPEPRTFTQKQIAEWIAQDEADMREYLELVQSRRPRQEA